MSTDNKDKNIIEEAKRNETIHAKEKKWSNRIARSILLVGLLVILIAAIGAFSYVRRGLQAVDADNTSSQEVTIPIGSTASDIAQILEEAGIVRNADLFNFYMKANNASDLQAGHYDFSPAMDASEVLAQLEAGGRPIFVDVDTTVTIVEGMMLEEIAQAVEAETAITAEDFMDQADDAAYIRRLEGQFPGLLAGLSDREDLLHPLEGYLFPATYDYFAGDTAADLIEKMVAKSNLEYQGLQDDLANTWLDYHEILTLASIIEKEGISDEDRGLISGVFYNRMNIDMPLQSDITVLYALGEHKEFVTYADLEVDSPYNLYQHTGLGPGPFNSPGLSAITAAIYPSYNDYYFFVADLDTQEIYYSSTQEEHDILVEEYVNARQRRIEAENQQGQEAEPDQEGDAVADLEGDSE